MAEDYYDPLVSEGPGCGASHPVSYWASTMGEETPDDGPITADLDVDVAVIGAGYTGLSAATFLAREHGVQAVVLEANRVGWGASGRNAGFVLRSTGRLSSSGMIKRWGVETARQVVDEFYGGIETVRELIRVGDIACDAQPEGFLKVAHRPDRMGKLVAQARLLKETFSYPVEVIGQERLKEEFLDSPEACGGLFFPDGFGIHPLKLAHGLSRLARSSGVRVHTNSPVTSWVEEGGRHVLITPGGRIRAKKVICASNAYTPKRFHPLLRNRTLPVLTSVIVTRPLTPEEDAASGLRTAQGVMDTRLLKYYFRRLPDGRLIFGGRGAIRGKDAELPVFRERLIRALHKTLPALRQVDYEYGWGGWITISLDDVPRVCQADSEGTVFYAMGYCGSGLAFSMQAGRRLAEKVVGISHDLPILSSPLKRFPFAPFRRVGQFAYYQYGRVRDAWR